MATDMVWLDLSTVMTTSARAADGNARARIAATAAQTKRDIFGSPAIRTGSRTPILRCTTIATLMTHCRGAVEMHTNCADRGGCATMRSPKTHVLSPDDAAARIRCVNHRPFQPAGRPLL